MQCRAAVVGAGRWCGHGRARGAESRAPGAHDRPCSPPRARVGRARARRERVLPGWRAHRSEYRLRRVNSGGCPSRGQGGAPCTRLRVLCLQSLLREPVSGDCQAARPACAQSLALRSGLQGAACACARFRQDCVVKSGASGRGGPLCPRATWPTRPGIRTCMCLRGMCACGYPPPSSHSPEHAVGSARRFVNSRPRSTGDFKHHHQHHNA